MSDYRFGDDYKLSIYPRDAMDGCGGIDMNKVEAVEIEWVDFIRMPDDRSRWFELFGTPERAARTLEKGKTLCTWCDKQTCSTSGGECRIFEYDALLEWLKGDA